MHTTDPTATAPTDPHDAARALVDKDAAVDALLRFGYGQDLRDRALFASAFAEDAELDFRPTARALGREVAVMVGRGAIVDGILAALASLDTAHIVTNCRIEVAGDTAAATAIVQAQHLHRDDHSHRLMLTNLYTVDLVRAGPAWVASRMRIDNVWFEGDPELLLHAETQS